MNFNKFSKPRYDAILNFQRDHMFVSFFKVWILRKEKCSQKAAEENDAQH